MKMMYRILILLTILFWQDQIECSLSKCTQRLMDYEIAFKANPNLKNVSYVKQRYPECGKSVTIMYSEKPPYILEDKKEGRPVGLLPDILELVFESCCFLSKEISFKAVDALEEFKPAMEHEILMPIQSSSNTVQYKDNDFVPLVKSSKVMILAKQKTDEEKGTELTALMMTSVFATWPLFLIALLMALTSGCFMWLLDTWFNEKEFPRRFPKGVWDGFWWAFVSMTTVGYGDKSPSSFFARFFSIIWIFIGITMFNMYTAVLTTALNVRPEIFDANDLTNVSIGLLKGSSLAGTVIILENGNPVEYSSIHELADALQKDEVNAIALDSYEALYYMKQLKEQVPLIRKHHTVDGIPFSYGIISKSANLTSFLKSFFLTNEDHSSTVSSYVLYNRWPDMKLKEEEVTEPTFFNSHSPNFRYTLIGLILITLMTIIVGLGLREFFKRHDKVLARYVDFMNSEIDFCITKKVEPSGENRAVVKEAIADCLSELDDFVSKWKTTLNGLKIEEDKREMSLVELSTKT